LKLIGLAAEEQRPPFVTDGFVADSELAEQEYQEITQRLAEAEGYFRTVVGETKQQAEWRAAVGNPVAVLAAEMRAADLAILGREAFGSDTFRALDPAAAAWAACVDRAERHQRA
jgi:hypothetical protein